jgi:hypothetical protein
MIRIAITPVAYAAIAATLTLGTVAFEPESSRRPRSPTPQPKAPPPAKADKRARR